MAFVAISAAAGMISCSEDNQPSVEFGRTLYHIYSGGETDVDIVLSEPASSNVIIPLTFSGNAEKNVDYKVSAESITIAQGETSGSIKIENIDLSAEKQLSIAFITPAGYKTGVKTNAVVTPDEQEALICSMKYDSADALESYVVKIEVTGAVSGKDLKTTEDIMIPLVLTGDGASNLAFSGTKSYISAPQPYALLNAGETTASAKFIVKSGFSGDLKANVSVDPRWERFVPGDNETQTITVKGVQTPDKLIGTWAFSEVVDLEEIELWYMEMEDDPDLLPVHNTGFKLTFTKESDGNVSVTPSGNGDFNNFFRKATVKLSAPMNMTSEGYTLGQYTSSENNMFVAESGMPEQINTYYKLSAANRAFSADEESIGEASIIFALDGDKLRVEFRDYDQPPFGEMWWDGFDADMFGFASLFVKE